MAPSPGILNLDKPAGRTSRDAVNHLQRLLGRGKIGHAGTLDPLATGVLVICLGAGTRLIRLVQAMPKTYEAEFQMGCTSDTDDVEGQVRPTGERLPSAEQIEAALPAFVGEVQQRPPAYSAIKVAGRRAYDLARRGEEVELKSRPVRIDELRLLDYDAPVLRLRVRCGSGVYIRSIGRDLGEQLGCGAVMSGLRRTAIGCFHAEDAVALDALRTREDIQQALRPLAAAASQLPVLQLDATELQRLGHGQSIEGDLAPGRQAAVLDPQGRLRAIAIGLPGGRLRAEINMPG